MRERADVNAQVAYPTRSQLHEGATRLLPRRSAQKKASAVKPLLITASSLESKRDGSIAVGEVQGNERGIGRVQR